MPKNKSEDDFFDPMNYQLGSRTLKQLCISPSLREEFDFTINGRGNLEIRSKPSKPKRSNTRVSKVKK
jgi:hypothetical protein